MYVSMYQNVWCMCLFAYQSEIQLCLLSCGIKITYVYFTWANFSMVLFLYFSWYVLGAHFIWSTGHR